MAWSKKDTERAPSKKDVKTWVKQTAANDRKHGRDSKANPNNKKNGKW